MSFLIQKSPDQRSFTSFPELIAGYHVFRRLSMPRHPPYTLSSLTKFIDHRHEEFSTLDLRFAIELKPITLHISAVSNSSSTGRAGRLRITVDLQIDTLDHSPKRCSTIFIRRKDCRGDHGNAGMNIAEGLRFSTQSEGIEWSTKTYSL